MYVHAEYKKNEELGINTTMPKLLAKETFEHEAYSLFLDVKISDGFKNEISVIDDNTREMFYIKAEDHLSQEQILFLKEIDSKSKTVSEAILRHNNITFREVRGIL